MKGSECKYCVGGHVQQVLTWKCGYTNRTSALIGYDGESKTILVDAQKLMRAIMIANPAQKPRHLRFVDNDGIDTL